MSCMHEAVFEGEELYIYAQYRDGNPYVRRGGRWFEVLRYAQRPIEYFPVDGMGLRDEGFTRVAPREVEYWVSRGWA